MDSRVVDALGARVKEFIFDESMCFRAHPVGDALIGVEDDDGIRRPVASGPGGGFAILCGGYGGPVASHSDHSDSRGPEASVNKNKNKFVYLTPESSRGPEASVNFPSEDCSGGRSCGKTTAAKRSITTTCDLSGEDSNPSIMILERGEQPETTASQHYNVASVTSDLVILPYGSGSNTLILSTLLALNDEVYNGGVAKLIIIEPQLENPQKAISTQYYNVANATSDLVYGSGPNPFIFPLVSTDDGRRDKGDEANSNARYYAYAMLLYGVVRGLIQCRITHGPSPCPFVPLVLLHGVVRDLTQCGITHGSGPFVPLVNSMDGAFISFSFYDPLTPFTCYRARAVLLHGVVWETRDLTHGPGPFVPLVECVDGTFNSMILQQDALPMLRLRGSSINKRLDAVRLQQQPTLHFQPVDLKGKTIALTVPIIVDSGATGNMIDHRLYTMLALRDSAPDESSTHKNDTNEWTPRTSVRTPDSAPQRERPTSLMSDNERASHGWINRRKSEPQIPQGLNTGDSITQIESDRIKYACLLYIGRSMMWNAPVAIVVRNAASGLYMVPGGHVEKSDLSLGGIATTFREFVEEIFGLSGAVAIDAAHALQQRATSKKALEGPFGAVPIGEHAAYLINGLLFNNIDDVVLAFVPTKECDDIDLVDLRYTSGSRTDAVNVAGKKIALHDKLGYNRVQFARHILFGDAVMTNASAVLMIRHRSDKSFDISRKKTYIYGSGNAACVIQKYVRRYMRYEELRLIIKASLFHEKQCIKRALATLYDPWYVHHIGWRQVFWRRRIRGPTSERALVKLTDSYLSEKLTEKMIIAFTRLCAHPVTCQSPLVDRQHTETEIISDLDDLGNLTTLHEITSNKAKVNYTDNVTNAMAKQLMVLIDCGTVMNCTPYTVGIIPYTFTRHDNHLVVANNTRLNSRGYNMHGLTLIGSNLQEYDTVERWFETPELPVMVMSEGLQVMTYCVSTQWSHEIERCWKCPILAWQRERSTLYLNISVNNLGWLKMKPLTHPMRIRAVLERDGLTIATNVPRPLAPHEEDSQQVRNTLIWLRAGGEPLILQPNTVSHESSDDITKAQLSKSAAINMIKSIRCNLDHRPPTLAQCLSHYWELHDLATKVGYIRPTICTYRAIIAVLVHETWPTKSITDKEVCNAYGVSRINFKRMRKLLKSCDRHLQSFEKCECEVARTLAQMPDQSIPDCGNKCTNCL